MGLEPINAADLYAVRAAILAGAKINFTLTEIDGLIALNAVQEFMPSTVRQKIDEALKHGTYREAEGSGSSLH